jgi:hypothetical protein
MTAPWRGATLRTAMSASRSSRLSTRLLATSSISICGSISARRASIAGSKQAATTTLAPMLMVTAAFALRGS